jgi:hypothetical protein
MRPLIERDLNTAHDRLAVPAISIVNNDQKQLSPQLVFLQMHDTEPGVVASELFIDPQTVNDMYSSPNRKAAMLKVIKSALGTPGAEDIPYLVPLRTALFDLGIRADIAVSVAEFWLAEDSNPDNHTPPSQRPDRQSVLGVIVHTRTHSYGTFLPIETRDGKLHVDYAPVDTNNIGLRGPMTIQEPDDITPNV